MMLLIIMMFIVSSLATFLLYEIFSVIYTYKVINQRKKYKEYVPCIVPTEITGWHSFKFLLHTFTYLPHIAFGIKRILILKFVPSTRVKATEEMVVSIILESSMVMRVQAIQQEHLEKACFRQVYGLNREAPVIIFYSCGFPYNE